MNDTPDRRVAAVHSRRPLEPDPPYELGLADDLRRRHDIRGLASLYGRFVKGETDFDAMMRRVVWRAGARVMGSGLSVGRGVLFRHLETFTIGSGVFLGEQSMIQGRFDGTCTIGDRVWVGPQSYFDARNLVIEDSVGWGPGARVLGSQHTGHPMDVPIIETELEIRPVRICTGADIGVNAVILPGVTVGAGAIIGAGAVVTADVPPNAVAVGVPARVIRLRGDTSNG